jgi:hypothetical protein
LAVRRQGNLDGNAVFLVDDLIYALVVELVDFDVALGAVARSVL